MQRVLLFLIFFLLLILVAFHFCFFQADAFSLFEIGRGAYTDEGWHTYQLRNWLNGQGFYLLATDSFLKAPLFNIVLLPFFLFFGQHLFVGRLVVILFSLLPFAYCLKTNSNKLFFLLLLIICYTHPLVFCYQHYLLPEMLAIATVLNGLFFFYEHFINRKIRFVLLGIFSFFLAFLFKAQFVYILILPFAYLSFYFFSVWNFSSTIKVVGAIFLTLTIFLLFYFLLWYFPNKISFYYYFSLLSRGQYTNVNDSWERAKYYYNDWLAFQPYWRNYITIFWVVLPLGFYLFCFTTTSKFFQVLFFLSLIWVIFEIHKFLAAYLPVRYILPLIVAALFNSTVVFSEILILCYKNFDNKFYRIGSVISLLLIGFIVSKNIKWDKRILENREYNICSVKNYLKSNLKAEDKVLGNW